MKRLFRIVSSLLSLLFAGLAYAQTKVPPFSHVVIVIQENRTPDNLFGSKPTSQLCTSEDPFEPGVDIVQGGLNLASKQHNESYSTCLTPNPGLVTGGGFHGHNGDYFPPYQHQGWVAQCDYNSSTGQCQMDGACLGTWPNCTQYEFVEEAAVQPYFDIATYYGFANYMFSTHQGPSFPAHQFLFGGSSAPVFPGDQYDQYFVAENTPTIQPLLVGCPAASLPAWPLWVDPDNNEGTVTETECYDRNTLVTYQDSTGAVHDWTDSWPGAKPAWKYYIPTDNNDANAAIWNGPEDDPQVCYFQSSGSGEPCTSSEYTNHISMATTRKMESAPVLKDIQNCQLPAISWVIPDERWSDHPSQKYEKGLGPDWVAAIIDAIGQSWQKSLGGGHCDYWGYGNSSPSPEPTAIFITWDDWGAFYDHVPPPAVYQGNASDQCTTLQAPNGWGCGYVYGFRVPLLVVSNWTPANTISGACGGTQNPPCPNFGTQTNPHLYVHDFGSILAFIENNFTQQGMNLPPIAPQTPIKYTYADQNSLDNTYNGLPAIPLWDFFQGPQRNFTPINPINSTDTASFFENYYYNNPNEPPIGPEDGDPLD